MRTRVYAISDPSEAADPSYAEGLRAAVTAALDYGLEGVQRGGERTPPVPTVLLAQAHLAARSGVSLDTVLRRYFAGYAILGDFLVEEGAGLLEDADLKGLLRSQAVLFDRLLAAVSEEHSREDTVRLKSSEQRRAERVQRLLDGELLDSSELGYELDSWHLGGVAFGLEARDAARDLAAVLDRRVLLLDRGEDNAWFWLGGRRSFEPEELERVLSFAWPARISLAIGEPGPGLSGWRLSHRQARATLPIALRGGPEPVRYRDVALLATILQDELLAASLRQLYLEPLEAKRDGGKVAKETLRAYFAAERNVSSAGAALGVNRNTVASRLRAIEAAIGRPLGTCGGDLETAMRLSDLSDPAWVQRR